ncbi:class A beta-lactamase-related serine hydrolase [Mucilaginibacter sp. RS28]|uniref:beta-lactamase n=1 Tax=Mucilaginibacter straminoryzae TaxID=2932774 RepID=A0A9X1X2A5_9SPHI|nr:serine hydrolase [Mucilaginibacter straminoryzae]MCJ8209693.1 class A beta-lactamase-related serine hydrolase [Mucilaginibacter straminoryzae]
MRKLLLLPFMLFAAVCMAQRPDTVFLENMLKSNSGLFEHILKHPTHNEVQILYTQIDRDEHNIPHFKSYSYRLNPKHYFYPASTVKLPTAIFALEKLKELGVKGLSRNSVMITDSAAEKQTRVTTDSTAKNGKPSIEQYIKKILLVSDNDAYNRLYEFVGRAEINSKLKKYGFNNTRIIGRLAVGDGGESARTTNPVKFYDDGKLVYTKPQQYDSNNYPMQLENMIQGKGYLDAKDRLVMKPFDFSDKNVYPLQDQQAVLKRLLLPEAFPEAERFNLTPDEYKFIYKYMSMFPTESDYPKYQRPEYYPAYCKFIFYGADSTASISPDIRIFNKVGDSYGYDIDNAYVVDFKNKVEFILTAVVQSNEDGIYNDNKYEYDTVCLPFLKNLGKVIYEYELKRPRQHKPNLAKFKFKY